MKTFTFKDKMCAKARPGQFLMLWIPRVDEIPLSILDAKNDGSVSVAVKNVGAATHQMHGLRLGDVVGVRGPFGNSFSPPAGKIVVVGGGTGMIPLLFLTRKARSSEKILFFAGAKTKDELLFLEELSLLLHESKGELVSTTEDGTCGITALCTEPLEEALKEERFDMVYCCGPERMIKRVFEIAEKKGVEMEASLERVMRCGIGLCGSCVVGKYRVCRDGPVFDRRRLREIRHELGVSKRDFDGNKIPI